MFTQDEKIVIQFHIAQALKVLSYQIIAGKIPDDDETKKEKETMHSILKQLS